MLGEKKLLSTIGPLMSGELSLKLPTIYIEPRMQKGGEGA